MRTQKIYASTIDIAAENILQLLKQDTGASRSMSSRNNVFYFNGWDGLGASAVLGAIAQRLAPTSPAGKRALAELEFDQLIHINCSMWESRRALQKAVAEQLKLPNEVIELFNRQDEEDDFKGVPQGSRTEIQQVVREMYRHIQKTDHRFLVIFHNGSNEEINLASVCGFPLSGYSTNKVLWTFQGRFRLKPRMKVDRPMASTGTTDVFISAVPQDERDSQLLWSYLVQQEASDVVAVYKITASTHSTIEQTAQVADCFLYMLELCFNGRHSDDYDLVTHAANYWVCDGIIQQIQQRDDDDDDDDSLWRAANALQREIQLDVDYHYLPSHLSRCAERKPYWTSPTYGVILIPTGDIPNGDMLFQHFDKLNVLKISRCTFDFQSPPFIFCHSLRFLWLDHCQDTGQDDTSTDGAEKGLKEDVRRCFQRLWVLDVRYTDCDQILSAQILDLMTQLRELNVIGAEDWDMGQLWGRLPNICKLRVKDSTITCSSSENDLFSEANKLVLLDFSGNIVRCFPMTRLSGQRVRCLETVMINNVYALQQIYFRGCSKLKNLLLGGRLLHTRSLDISGTAVKTLDLSSTHIRNLDELYLLGCEKLCAILWPPKHQMREGGLSKLCIDTTQPAPTAQPRKEKGKRDTTSAIGKSVTGTTVVHGSQLIDEFPWYIFIKDARLLASLEAVRSDSRKMYVEVSSAASHTTAAGDYKYKGIRSTSNSERQVQPQTAAAIYAADITVDYLKLTSEGDGDASGFIPMCPCPDVPDLPNERGYIHIQDQTRTELLWTRGEEGNNTIVVPEFVPENARILHVHDALSITTTPLCMEFPWWQNLEWCRVERCPRVERVFFPETIVEGILKYRLRIFWASHLPKARYIFAFGYHRRFPNLTCLHIDSCPRLIHVLPLYITLIDVYALSQLKTLEITWCGDLEEVFPVEKDYLGLGQWPGTLYFTGLKRLHLHELPRLRSFCGSRTKISAPNLETVKIRGCWSLQCLPDVGSGSKVVECDCEKEWWDMLKWEDGSRASRYKPIHSRYYKKTMLRGSVLR